jgi:hypothetical protein
MSFVTERLKAQAKASEVQQEFNKARFKERQHLASVSPNLWDELGEVLQSFVNEFSGEQKSRRVIVRKTDERIEVMRENELAFLAFVQFDRTHQAITYECPTQRPNAGNPPRGTYKIVLDANKRPSLYGGKKGQIVSIEVAAQEILEPALFGY